MARANSLRRPRAVPESVIPKNVLRDAPSQISLVVTGKLRGFSTERLLRMLARLGRDIDIVIRPSKGKTGKVNVVRK